MIVAFAMMTVMNVNAQDNNVQPYYELDQMPKLIEIMPAPPAFDSPEFANDIVRYGWGKQQREDEERLELAIADAEWDDLTKVFLQWKDAFGLEISEMGTPEIYKLMVTALGTGVLGTLLVISPSDTTRFMLTLAGVALIAEGAMNLFVSLFMVKTFKNGFEG